MMNSVRLLRAQTLPILVAVTLACGSLAQSTSAADGSQEMFRARVAPFISKYCVECHNAKKAEAELNLARFETAEAVADEFRQWEHVLTFVERAEMPPMTAARRPESDERSAFLKSLRTVLDLEAKKLAGDPGVVLPRRLSNAEYDHSIRDLTGVDIRPTRAFPVDPAAGEGFDNTGEALAMSPSLFAKLYGAAQHVADHALLTTRGIEFAPYPVSTFADRTKFYEQSIIQFYERHQVDYRRYLTACWEYRHRGDSDKSVAIDAWARTRGLSPKYFAALDAQLSGDPNADRYYLGWLRRRWQAVPAPIENAKRDEDATRADRAAITGRLDRAANANEIRNALDQLARELQTFGKQLAPRETEAIVSNAGNGPVQHLDRRRKTAAERDTFDSKNLQPNRRLVREFRNLPRDGKVKLTITAPLAAPPGAPPAAQAAVPTAFVLLKSPNFSTSSPESYKPNDEKKNFPLRPLVAAHAAAQLDTLKFGSHPAGGTLDPESLVLPVPGSIVVELPTSALGDAREIRFFADAELDRQNSKADVVSITFDEAAPSPPTMLVVPDSPSAGEIAKSGAEFCRLFPNRFFYVDDTRGLSAGFHLIEGVFRDDQPLMKSVLDDAERAEIDRLWSELEFVTGITEKMLRGFVFFERSERNFLKHDDFDPFKEEDPKLVEHETLLKFERVYLDRSNVKQPIEELTNHPIHIFFEQIRNGLAARKRQSHEAEKAYLGNLESFARRAYRRPLTDKETADLRRFFADVVAQADQGVEQAVRASIVRILMSPYFGCRIVPAPAGDTVRPLADFDLASRLSYFLWSSTPDVELLALAEAGRLRDEAVLLAQTRRMLKDPRVNDLAREFFGQWLGYRDFPQQEAVDRSVFRDFDDALRQSMYEEPTRLATHLIRENLPATRLLDADFTFVDERLAKHYGVPFQAGRSRDSAGDWQMVEGLREQGRSGVMGMAVFLTKNSQPQRTSPVKRGFWVVHKVLGEHIPAPPADVVALPAKETDTNGKTIRELLALHVEDQKCARCHVRFDAVGLAMEGFDPIGRRRVKDLAGRPVDNVVKLTDGTDARGVPEFAGHLARERRGEYLDTLCRKLLGYALGRSLQLSDDVLLKEMRVALDKHEDRFVPLFEVIVSSPQFRNQRCRDFQLSSFREQNRPH